MHPVRSHTHTHCKEGITKTSIMRFAVVLVLCNWVFILVIAARMRSHVIDCVLHSIERASERNVAVGDDAACHINICMLVESMRTGQTQV